MILLILKKITNSLLSLSKAQKQQKETKFYKNENFKIHHWIFIIHYSTISLPFTPCPNMDRPRKHLQHARLRQPTRPVH